MGFSRPFNLITLLAIGGLLLGLTILLVLASAEGNRPPDLAERLPLASEALSPSAIALAEEAALTSFPSATVSRGPLVPPTGVPAVSETGQVQQPTPTANPTETARPSPAPVDTTPTVPAASQTPAADLPLDAWRRVEIPELGISFDVPASWARVGDKWAWSPEGAEMPRAGFEWSESKSAAEMLPTASAITDQEILDLGWTQASSFQLERFQGEDVAAVERHVIVQVSDEYTGDFYASGRSLPELASVDSVLGRLLATFTYRASPEGPVETTIGFLNALMRDSGEEGARSFLSDSLQGASPLGLLNLDALYTSFGVTLLPAIDGRIGVQASLNYPGGRVEQRVLFLVRQEEGWRIDRIAAEL